MNNTSDTIKQMPVYAGIFVLLLLPATSTAMLAILCAAPFAVLLVLVAGVLFGRAGFVFAAFSVAVFIALTAIRLLSLA